MRGVESAVATLAAFDGLTAAATVDGQPEVVYADFVTGNYFPLIGIAAWRGRLLGPDDDRPEQPAVVVVSYAYWVSRLGADPRAIGRTIVLKDLMCTIVGVTGPEYFGRQTAGEGAALTLPLSLHPRLALKDHTTFELIARVPAGSSMARVRARIDAAYQAAFRELRDPADADEPVRAAQIELESARRGDFEDDRFAQELWLLQALAGLVLIIASVNVASLQIARGLGRERELAVRFALGATRTQIVRQLLVESLVVACAGGACGVWVAHWTAGALLAALRGGSPSSQPLLDPTILLFTAALIVSAALLCGLVPALRLTAMGEMSGTAVMSLRTRGHAGAARTGWLLVVAQVALSITLLLPAALLVRSVQRLARVDLGFDADRVLVMWIFPTLAGYEGARELALYDAVTERIGAIPGVDAASLSRYSILRRGRERGLTIHGDQIVRDPGASYVLDAAAPRFFVALGLRMLAGRDFSPRDGANSPRVAVVNEPFARKYFADGRAVGHAIEVAGARREIVGVVGGMRFGVRDPQFAPAVYIAYAQAPADMLGQMLFKIRTPGDPHAVVPAVRRAIQQVAPALAPVGIATAAEDVANASRAEASLAAIVSVAGFVALFLAMVGLYGTLTQAITRRVREIGVRMAMGARPADVERMIVREVGRRVLIGVLIGVPGAALVLRVTSSFLFGLGTADLSVVAFGLFVAASLAALAGYLPARRAARIDPLVALGRE